MDKSALEQLVLAYSPNKDVIDEVKKIRLLATVAPSASGKTTVMGKLAESSPRFGRVLDETSRPPRTTERQGRDYLFRSKDEILKDLQEGELVQAAIGPNGDMYATRLEDYPTDKIALMALIPSAVENFRKMPLASFWACFIVPASFEQWQFWLNRQARLSSWTGEKLQARLSEAKKSYEFALADKQIRFVLNDDISKAANRLAQAAVEEVPDDEEVARTQAFANYQKLKGIVS